MKRIYLFFVVLPSFMLLLSACKKRDDPDTSCQYLEFIQPLLECMNMPRPADSYCYPCQEERCRDFSGQEWLDAVSIPPSILEEISTQAVIQAIWEHPEFNSISSPEWMEYQTSFEDHFFNNNAYIELTRRPNAGEALLQRFVLFNPATTDIVMELRSFEILISQTVFLSQLTNAEKKQIVKITLELINAWIDIWGGDFKCWFPEFILLGKSMVSANYAPFVEAVNSDEQLSGFISGRWGWMSYFFYNNYDIYDEHSEKIFRFCNDFLLQE